MPERFRRSAILVAIGTMNVSSTLVVSVRGGVGNASRWPVEAVVSRYTFHIVWLLVFAGIASTLYGGPLWSYPIALLLSMIAAAFVTAYPTDNSLRRTLGFFGGFLVFVATTRFIADGLTPVALHESLSVLLCGAAGLWSAIFPHCEYVNGPQ